MAALVVVEARKRYRLVVLNYTVASKHIHFSSRLNAHIGSINRTTCYSDLMMPIFYLRF